MQEPDIYNIPAFRRKRSIAAKARNKSSSPKIRRKRVTKKQTNEEILTDIPIRNTYEPEDIFQQPIIEIKKRDTEIREMKLCGVCEGYFEKIDVAIIKLTEPLREGDFIIFEKQDGLFEQEVKSMQINRRDVKLAHTGSDIGLKVFLKPKIGTPVYKVI